MGDLQIKNAALSVNIANAWLSSQDRIVASHRLLERGLEEARISGRHEVYQYSSALLHLDGAHTAASLEVRHLDTLGHVQVVWAKLQ